MASTLERPAHSEWLPQSSLSSPTSSDASSSLSSSPVSSSSTLITPPSSYKDVPSRDPHILPDFKSRDLNASGEPILYLPPLLSSLPLPHEPLVSPAALRAPLTTAARLPSIDDASLALHKALHHFAPVTSDYASSAYEDAFNWDELRLPVDMEGDWYCVCFRSVRKAGSDSGPLYAADQKAHEEAVQNGGLIMYWYGTPHPETGVNLATCIWQTRAHAVAANSRPHHLQAIRLAAKSYDMYDLERYRLRKVAGEAELQVVDYKACEDIHQVCR